jgi:outer membrane protein assembly factor BamA
MIRCAVLVACALVACSATTAHGQAETLGEVRVHGNHTTPDSDILSLAGLILGQVVTDEMLRTATERLEQSQRFDSVEVRKRYRSIDNPNDILVIIVVNEVAGVTLEDLTPGPLKRMRSLGMWLPVLDYADGYGFTYGARITFVDALGKRSRISVPLTWGGDRRAGVEVERAFSRGPFTRVEAAAAIHRRVNPHFETADARREVWTRAERTVRPWLRAGGGVRWTDVEFGALQERYLAPSIDVTLDTRVDPGFPRNAVYASAGVERLQFGGGNDVVRVSTDVAGYVGLFGSSVLAVRAANIRTDRPVPPFEQSLLGGAASLRGYEFGYRAGDNLAVVSAEVRVPLTSPIVLGKLGVKAFVDAGTVYPHGARLSDQHFDRGVGGGVFMSWAVLRMGLDVAWPVSTDSRKPRWHFGMGVSF